MSSDDGPYNQLSHRRYCLTHLLWGTCTLALGECQMSSTATLNLVYLGRLIGYRVRELNFVAWATLSAAI